MGELVLLEDPGALARYQGFDEEVYRDFLELQAGRLPVEVFDAKYLTRKALLVLDLTGFTLSATRLGSLQSLLRVIDAQKVCLPVLEAHGASFVRAFADDVVALFETPAPALAAAFEIHARTRDFQASGRAGPSPADCCIGLGFGDVYAVGPNHAMGEEMNMASKLGEDIARGGETLLTERAHAALCERADAVFEAQTGDDQLFPYYRATPSR